MTIGFKDGELEDVTEAPQALNSRGPVGGGRFAAKLAAIKLADLDGAAVDDFTANWFE